MCVFHNVWLIFKLYCRKPHKCHIFIVICITPYETQYCICMHCMYCVCSTCVMYLFGCTGKTEKHLCNKKIHSKSVFKHVVFIPRWSNLGWVVFILRWSNLGWVVFILRWSNLVGWVVFILRWSNLGWVVFILRWSNLGWVVQPSRMGGLYTQVVQSRMGGPT